MPRTDSPQLTLHGLMWIWNQLPQLEGAAFVAAQPLDRFMTDLMAVVLADMTPAEETQFRRLFSDLKTHSERIETSEPARPQRTRRGGGAGEGEAGGTDEGPGEDDPAVLGAWGLVLRGTGAALSAMVRFLWRRIAKRVGKARGAKLVKDAAQQAAKVGAPIAAAVPLVAAPHQSRIIRLMSVLGWTAAGTLAASGGAAIIGAASGAREATANLMPFLLLGLGLYVLSER